MKYLSLTRIENPSSKLEQRYQSFDQLMSEITKHYLPDDISRRVNKTIEKLNAVEGESRHIIKSVKKAQFRILKMLEEETNLVAKNHYRNKWMGYGMIMGIPFGVAFGISIDQLAFLGIGLPIGLAIGIAIGTEKDNKAKAEGKQLNVIGDMEF
ncbi:MAG: hypothetical protein JXQ90_13655 [Cyclobacteriaceae bacterium]